MTGWLRFVGIARDKRVAEIRLAVSNDKVTKEDMQYLLDLIEFQHHSQERRKDGLN